MEKLVDRVREAGALAKLVGDAPSFLKAVSQLPVIAKSEAAVLILGETGTGKELVARAIHYSSGRAAFPFVAINCGSLPDTLLEDELFGHVRGAFTGAHARRDGLISQAKGGTLFLDEIDTLSKKAQIDLLRVLQERRFRPIGTAAEQDADIRILGATNAPLSILARSGQFRTDLYYRLCIFSIILPPLRERHEDILKLANHFLQKHSIPNRPYPRFTPEACAVLLSWNWPGNVRELENTIIRGIHLCKNNSICVADLGLLTSTEGSTASQDALSECPSFSVAKRRAIAMFEKGFLTRLMTEQAGNVSRVARIAGKDRSDIGKLLRKHSIDAKEFRSNPASSRD
jgi:DNA-binding NtrC family response regulator